MFLRQLAETNSAELGLMDEKDHSQLGSMKHKHDTTKKAIQLAASVTSLHASIVVVFR